MTDNVIEGTARRVMTQRDRSEQNTNEVSGRSYFWFLQYLRMGKGRTVEGLPGFCQDKARAEGQRIPHIRTLWRWYTDQGWADEAAEWDRAQLQRDLDGLAHSVASQRLEGFRAEIRMLQICMHFIEEEATIQETPEDGGEPFIRLRHAFELTRGAPGRIRGFMTTGLRVIQELGPLPQLPPTAGATEEAIQVLSDDQVLQLAAEFGTMVTAIREQSETTKRQRSLEEDDAKDYGEQLPPGLSTLDEEGDDDDQPDEPGDDEPGDDPEPPVPTPRVKPRGERVTPAAGRDEGPLDGDWGDPDQYEPD